MRVLKVVFGLLLLGMLGCASSPSGGPEAGPGPGLTSEDLSTLAAEFDRELSARAAKGWPPHVRTGEGGRPCTQLALERERWWLDEIALQDALLRTLQGSLCLHTEEGAAQHVARGMPSIALTVESTYEDLPPEAPEHRRFLVTLRLRTLPHKDGPAVDEVVYVARVSKGLARSGR